MSSSFLKFTDCTCSLYLLRLTFLFSCADSPATDTVLLWIGNIPGGTKAVDVRSLVSNYGKVCGFVCYVRFFDVPMRSLRSESHLMLNLPLCKLKTAQFDSVYLHSLCAID